MLVTNWTTSLAYLEGNGDDSELDPAAEACREVGRTRTAAAIRRVIKC